jgi:hypothetical protein
MNEIVIELGWLHVKVWVLSVPLVTPAAIIPSVPCDLGRASFLAGSDCPTVHCSGSCRWTGNVADRVEGACTKLAGAFRDYIRHGENLIAKLVKKKMVIAEMASAHVPMKILGLQKQGEDIGQQVPQFARNFHYSFASEATRNIPPGFSCATNSRAVLVAMAFSSRSCKFSCRCQVV